MSAIQQRSDTPLVRVRHRQDEWLRAGDLAADVTAEAAHRERHVAAAHRTWGVAIGLGVEMLAGGAAVACGPGLAYDPCGRELPLARPRRLPAPVREDGTLVDLVLDVATCPGAELHWRDAGCPGGGVRLARFVVVAGLLADPDTTVAAVARPLWGGRVGAGSTAIELECELLMSAWIDTTAGGFDQTPRYVVTLERAPEDLEEDVSRARRSPVIGPLCSLRDESPGGFTLDLRLAAAPGPGASILPQTFAARVTWLGVQPPERCDLDNRKDTS